MSTCKFEYTVDTKPMAEQISAVSRHVNATTGAVVAMQAAVILAEEKAAGHICRNVNKGFYSLIRSQISQKVARLQSEVDSHFMQLVQQKKALVAIKNRLERDYNMIANRNSKLFNGLNANLRQRIFELDKPTIDFAVREVDKVNNRTKYLTATIPVTQLESLTASQKILASNVKFRGLNVIESMKSFLQNMNSQKKLTDQILINDSRYTATATIYTPVVIGEFKGDQLDKSIEIIVSDVGLSGHAKAAIQNRVYVSLDTIGWASEVAPDEETVSCFSKLVASSSKSQRVNDMTLKLFQSTNFQTI